MMKVMVVTMMMMVWYKICNDDGRIRGRMMKGMMLIVIMMIIRMMILIVMVHGNEECGGNDAICIHMLGI